MSRAYAPSFTGPFNETTLPSTVSPAPRLYGNGTPEGVMPGVPGQVYEDLDSTDQWIKLRGTAKLGWAQLGQRPPAGSSGGGGGSADPSVFYGVGDPNGAVAASRPAFYYNSAGEMWAKTTAVYDTMNWERIL